MRKVLSRTPQGQQVVIGVIDEFNGEQVFAKRVKVDRAYFEFLDDNDRPYLTWALDEMVLQNYDFDRVIIVETDGQRRILTITRSSIDTNGFHDESDHPVQKRFVPISCFNLVAKSEVPKWLMI